MIELEAAYRSASEVNVTGIDGISRYNVYNICNVIRLIYHADHTMYMDGSRNTQTMDRRTLALLSNGDIPAWSSQELYEYAWSLGIRHLRESDLKPDTLIRKRRTRHLNQELNEYAWGYAQ